jgi:LacI family transcriptional regulator
VRRASTPADEQQATTARRTTRRPSDDPAGATTIYSVARHAGVSIASVSRVLQGSATVSEATRRRVLDAVEALNYVPTGAARSLAVRHHEAQALVLPELAGPYYSELLMGFESRAAELGHGVLLLQAAGRDDLAAALRRLAGRVDGMAVLGSAAIPDAAVDGLRGRRPVVLVAGDPRPGVATIAVENASSTRYLTEHLMEHGRRRIVFVGDPQAGPDVRDRHRGYLEAHVAAGRPAAEPVRVGFREQDGADVGRRWLAGEVDADAMVCANDELALSVMRRVQAAGTEVPDDLAVVGFDDLMTARYVRPGLTTVRQPVRELGALAAEQLHELVAGRAPAADPTVLPTLPVLRGSCGCPDTDPADEHDPGTTPDPDPGHPVDRSIPPATRRHEGENHR